MKYTPAGVASSAVDAVVVPTMDETYVQEYQYYDKLHADKYRDEGQSFYDHAKQFAEKSASDSAHCAKIYEALVYRRFLPAGRVQAALGASQREVSPFNCSASQTIEDDTASIYDALKQAALTLRLGTGIGYNFSRLRPRGAEIKKLKTGSSGPLSFMGVFNQSASTISSAGHRRGAQMGILNVDHPDIEEFIDAKMVPRAFTYFNLSVGVTDNFMTAVNDDAVWPLIFNGKICKTLSARYLWAKIVRNAYQSAEPGVLFIDRFNEYNNLYYCEHIDTTNPCSEQPLPPHGLCTLGSFNWIMYVYSQDGQWLFDKFTFIKDIYTFVEVYDNIFDEAVYAIPEHRKEALSKRRIGLGATGIANAIELLLGRKSYGSAKFCNILDDLCSILTNTAYEASVKLAKKRGPFPLFHRDKYMKSKFVERLPQRLQNDIYNYGIRNSHLISYAPCGTISQCAGNVSSGVEPIFYHSVDRDVFMKNDKIKVTLNDFNVRHYNFKGKTLEDCSVSDHLNVAAVIQHYCDSSISKTVNVAADCPYEEYEQIYWKAYQMGLKGITVFRPTELRGAVITKAEAPQPVLSTFADAHCTNGACTL